MLPHWSFYENISSEYILALARTTNYKLTVRFFSEITRGNGHITTNGLISISVALARKQSVFGLAAFFISESARQTKSQTLIWFTIWFLRNHI